MNMCEPALWSYWSATAVIGNSSASSKIWIVKDSATIIFIVVIGVMLKSLPKE